MCWELCDFIHFPIKVCLASFSANSTVSSSAGSALAAGGQHGQYLRVVRLVHHADKLPKRELFMYAATAALLTMFVEQKTDFMKVRVCRV